jgi:tetratricopeptide (TPR) repeat protein
MNLADKLITADNCRDGISKIENLFNKKSFLDAYIRMKYVDELKACENSISISEQTEYAQKIINALKVSAKIRPLYARNWIMLGSFNAVLVVSEKDKEKKEELIKEVDSYFEKALSMAPRHQEVFSEWARAYFAAGEYQKMKEKSEQCIALNEDCNSCYWYLGLAEILLNDIKSGKENIEIARAKRFPVETEQYLNQLALIYTKNRNNKELVLIYESLIKLVPENVQYHASLAFLYKELGYYGEASKYAMKVLQLQPENTEALNFAESMLYYDSNDPIIYTSLGYIYGQLGEDEKSRQEFLTAKSIYLQLIANYYKNPKNHFKLAEIYKNLGEYENAIRETLIYVDLDPNKGVMNQAEEFLNTLPLPKEKIDLKLLRPNLYK